jgi:LIVCS family branched-chain amino acid:cation transporter
MKKQILIVLSTGLAIFSMFFGSGNLVFPLLVGEASGTFPWIAFLGIFLTGVIVPMLGVLAIYLFKGDSRLFFAQLGAPATFWFPLIALSLMGPFGVLARCITVAHGAFCLVFPGTSLPLFSIMSCALIFVLTTSRQKIVPLLGAILTPFLLLSLILIGFHGLTSTNTLPTLEMAPHVTAWSAFKNGVFEGYQTMDLLAAFFFATFVIQHLKAKAASCTSIRPSRIFLVSSVLGMSLLGGVYLLLVFLGHTHAASLKGIAPQAVFGTLAHQVLGPMGGLLVCAAVILACLTTTVVLASLFSEFFRKDIAKNKISHPLSLGITLFITFATSNLEFSGIARILGPILDVSYPALITLASTSIIEQMWGWRFVRIPCAIAFLCKLFVRWV